MRVHICATACAVRASLGIYNTSEEVDALLAAVDALSKRAGDSGYAWKPDDERWIPVA